MDAVGEPTLAVPVVTESIITQTSTEKSDNYAVPADDVQHLVRTEESAGATLRDLHLRLPKVRGKGNVRENKTTFTKSRKWQQDPAALAAPETDVADVELDSAVDLYEAVTSCSDTERTDVWSVAWLNHPKNLTKVKTFHGFNAIHAIFGITCW